MPGMVDTLAMGAPVGQAKAVCVFLHGRGQTPEAMVEAVVRRLSAPDVAYILPRARDQSWYAARAIDPLTEETRADLAASTNGVARCLAGLDHSRPILLAGFSQGACLALELACLGTPGLAAVVAFTGCRVGVPTDLRPLNLTPGLPVYLSAGSNDSWIPVAAFAEAVAELGRARAALRTDVFPDRPHEVSPAEIAMLDATLADLSAGRAPRFGAAR